jgi:hypothetical protein
VASSFCLLPAPTHPHCSPPSIPKEAALDGVLHLEDKRIEHLKTFLTGTLLAISLSATVAWSQEDQARYVTVTYTTSIIGTNAPAYQNILQWQGSNSIAIAEGEVGEIQAVAYPYTYKIIKNSLEFDSQFLPQVFKVVGPATIMGYASYSAYLYDAPHPARNGMMTVKILPLTYSPQKSVTVAPGMGNVQIELESSTNLLSWAASTNGVYNDDLRFFRVKLTKLNP